MNQREQIIGELDEHCRIAKEKEGTIFLSPQSFSLLPCIIQKIKRCYEIGVSREDVKKTLSMYT